MTAESLYRHDSVLRLVVPVPLKGKKHDSHDNFRISIEPIRPVPEISATFLRVDSRLPQLSGGLGE